VPHNRWSGFHAVERTTEKVARKASCTVVIVKQKGWVLKVTLIKVQQRIENPVKQQGYIFQTIDYGRHNKHQEGEQQWQSSSM
jgi:hypothetical protein